MKKKVLICDDNSVMLEIFKFVLKKENISVLTLPNGNDLFSTAKLHAPSLIFLDLMMPGKDGIMALKELNGDPETAPIPVVVVSSSVNPEILSQARELGAKGFIEKPFCSAGILETVRKYITPEKAAAAK